MWCHPVGHQLVRSVASRSNGSNDFERFPIDEGRIGRKRKSVKLKGVAMSVSESCQAAEYVDPVIELYKKGIDRTLLRENLKLSVQERFDKFEHFMEYVHELREAGRRALDAG